MTKKHEPHFIRLFFLIFALVPIASFCASTKINYPTLFLTEISSRPMDSYQPWRISDKQISEINPIGSMIGEDESRFLFWLGANYFKGIGIILDLGPLAGGSTYSLANGVLHNIKVSSKDQVIYSYDLWSFWDSWGVFFPNKIIRQGQDILPFFIENLANFHNMVIPQKGNLLNAKWDETPIEIIFIDAAKTPQLMEHIVNEFYPMLIPGHSLVLQQDFISAECPWIHIIQEHLSDYFEIMDSPEGGTVCFRIIRQIPANILRDNFYSSLNPHEAIALIENAANRLKGWNRLCILLAKAHYLALIGEGYEARRVFNAVLEDKEYDPSVEFDINMINRILCEANS